MKVNMVIVTPNGREADRREGVETPTIKELQAILEGPVVQIPAIKAWEGAECAAFTNSDAVHDSSMVIMMKAEDKDEPLVRHK